MGVKVQLYWVSGLEERPDVQASELGSSRGVQEPMIRSLPSDQECIDRSLIEDITQLKRTDLAEGAVICQVCGARIREGGRVTVSAFRSGSDLGYEIDGMFCRGHGDEYSRSGGRSFRELVVRGRVGMVSDAAMQSSWPVLLDPELVAVSPIDAVEAYTPGETDPAPGADDEETRVDVTRSFAGQGSSGYNQPPSWCDGGGSE